MPETGDVQPQTQNQDWATLQNKFSHGTALHQQGRLAEAERICRAVLQQQPNHVGALNLLGVIASQTQHTEQAIELFERAITLKPDFAAAFNNRGLALRNLQRPEQALASFDKAIALKPDFAMAHRNRGNVLRDLSCLTEAIASYDMAITLNPDFAAAYLNRGMALRDLQRPEEALASCDEAIALKPDYAEAHHIQSLCLLQLGRFEEGWRQYEWRKKCAKPLAARYFPQSLWLGEQDIAGKTLFIWWEQGLGDTIQFCRYAKLAEARGAKVVMSVQQPLGALFIEISPTIQIVNQDEVPTNFHYHCPFMSLPLAFKTTLETIPTNTPYLKANVEKSLFWKEKLGEKNKLRVGLVWSGGFRPNQPELWAVDKRRNIPLAKLAVLKHPDIEFYSLQKGQSAESDLAELTRNNWGGPDIIDFIGLLNDFSDTAGLVENLDLVISVDTSTAHLAGAMGKPVSILNRFDTSWRWLLDRDDSPWYPSARLFRQDDTRKWDNVIERVHAALWQFM